MKQYFEANDFNYIEDNLDELTQILQIINDRLPSFNPKYGGYDEQSLFYIQDAYRIEEGIKNIYNYILPFPNYIYKKWLNSSTDTSYKNFSWDDYKNWLNALASIKDYKEKIEIRYCSQGYCGDTIWL